MLTPKEKAIDIVDKIQLDSRYEMIPTHIAKIIGLKMVDEMIGISEEAMLFKQSKRDWLQEVKQEIQKL